MGFTYEKLWFKGIFMGFTYGKWWFNGIYIMGFTLAINPSQIWLDEYQWNPLIEIYSNFHGTKRTPPTYVHSTSADQSPPRALVTLVKS
jgi:hypothetical protein